VKAAKAAAEEEVAGAVDAWVAAKKDGKGAH